MVKSLKQLQEENRMLKAKAATERDFDKLEDEKTRLKKENFALRHGKKVYLLKRVGRGFKRMGQGAASSGRSVNKKMKKKTGYSFGLNPDFFGN